MGNTIIDWKQYGKSYLINNCGILINAKTKKQVAVYVDSSGYKSISITENNKTVRRRIHRIVASVFIPNPNCYRCVNHLDGNKLNNNIDNLEWCTHLHNARHYWRIASLGVIKKRQCNRSMQGKKVKAILSSGEELVCASVKELREKLNIKHRGISCYIDKGIAYKGVLIISI